MKRLLIVAFLLTLCSAMALGADTVTELRTVRAENRILKARITSLEKKLAEAEQAAKDKASGAGAPAASESSKPSSPSAAPALRKPTGATKVFGIYENNPEWWRDPAVFLLEFSLRDMVQVQDPKEAVSEWLVRNKNFVGEDVNWVLRIVSADPVSEEEAGREYYTGLGEVKRQEEQVEQIRQRPMGNYPQERESRQREIAQAEMRLRQLQVQSDQWKSLLDNKGGAMLTVVFMGQSSGGRGGDPIEVKMAVSGRDAERLTRYEEAKRGKYPQSRQRRWPIRIQGKISAFEYDGRAVHMMVDGMWREEDGSGDPPQTAMPGMGAGAPGQYGPYGPNGPMPGGPAVPRPRIRRRR
jgi:hypothetical protein